MNRRKLRRDSRSVANRTFSSATRASTSLARTERISSRAPALGAFADDPAFVIAAAAAASIFMRTIRRSQCRAEKSATADGAAWAVRP
jgi:hypothetical protein